MSDEAQEPFDPTGCRSKVHETSALECAQLAAQIGEVPIGAVIVCDGEVIVVAHNRREIDNDPSATPSFSPCKRLQKSLPLEAGLYGLRDAGTCLMRRADGQCSY